MSTSASSGLRSSTSQVSGKNRHSCHVVFALWKQQISDFSFSSLIVDHSGLVTGVAFGENAQFLTSAGMDRSLKFYSL